VKWLLCFICCCSSMHGTTNKNNARKTSLQWIHLIGEYGQRYHQAKEKPIQHYHESIPFLSSKKNWNTEEDKVISALYVCSNTKRLKKIKCIALSNTRLKGSDSKLQYCPNLTSHSLAWVSLLMIAKMLIKGHGSCIACESCYTVLQVKQLPCPLIM